MDEFRKSLQERRDTVLNTLREKMTSLRSENTTLKKILQDNNLTHPFVDSPLDSESHSISEDSDSSSDPNGTDSSVSITQTSADGIVESEIIRLKRELSNTQFDLQKANGDLLNVRLELESTQKHCQTLKEVNRITKELVRIRDQEAVQLKEKLKEIETTMGERETELMAQNLRAEYTKQIENIKKLRILYEQRARSADVEIESLKRKLADRNKDVDNELLKNQEKQKQIDQLEEEVKRLNGDFNTLTENFKDNKNEMDLLKNDLHTINTLFSKILLNHNGNDEIRDLERLKVILEENRQLLIEVTKRSNKCSIISDSVLPKLLCDLIVEAFSTDNAQTYPSEDEEINYENAQLLNTEDIMENLPKIWRILTELIIHQKKIDPIHIEENSKSEDCFNSIETPSGPQMVLSVSKTFIKLKNLILEKKSLQKETKRLNILNTHLQQTLTNQENRLGVVGLELTKTWHLVNRMKREHRQLHTHEQVLRYQLQQKRRMLTMLKEDLESCRHKWTRAREKNQDSEIQWKNLREEFSSRKDQSTSVESGYSDEQITDEDGDVEDNTEDTSIKTKLTPKIPTNESLEEMFNRLSSIHNPDDPLNNSLNTITEENSQVINENLNPQTNLEVQEENTGQTIDEVLPGPSSSPGGRSSTSPSGLTQTEEEYVAHRTERITKLEQQCQDLSQKVSSNQKKGEELSQQLDTLHNIQVEANRPDEIDSSQTDSNLPTITTENTSVNSTKDSTEIESNSQISVENPLPIQDNEPTPGPSSTPDSRDSESPSGLTPTEEEYMTRRAERIKRLELQCQDLFNKVSSNKKKGDELSQQLDTIHARQEERNMSNENNSSENETEENNQENAEEDPNQN